MNHALGGAGRPGGGVDIEYEMTVGRALVR